MASLGELVATMTLNTAQFVGALGKSEQAAADAQRKITRSIKQMESAFVGMVLGIASVNKAMELFNANIERGSKLQELANATGVAVGELDELSLAVSLAGTDMATLEKQFKSLSVKMVESTNPQKESARLFKAIGVEIKDASGKMLPAVDVYKQMMTQLAAIEDPVLRVAVATSVFGKAGMDAAKAAMEFAESQALAAEQVRLYGKASNDSAKMSKDFGDQMVLNKDALMRMVQPIVNQLLPVFADMRKAFGEATQGSADLAAGFGTLLAQGIRIFGAGLIVLVGTLKSLAINFAGVTAAYIAFHDRGLKVAVGIIADMNKETEANNEATVKAAAAMLGYGTAQEKAGNAAKAVAVDTKAAQDALNGQSDAAKKAAEQMAKLREKWLGMIEAAGSGIDTKTVAALAELTKYWKAAGLSAEQYAKVRAFIQSQDSAAIAAANASKKAVEDLANEYWNAIKAAGKFADDTRKSTADILDQANAVGKGKDALIDLQTATKKLAIDAMPGLTEASKDVLKALVDQEAAARKLFNANVALAEERSLRDALEDEVALLGQIGVARDKAAIQLRLMRVLTSDASEAEKKHAETMAALGVATINAHEATRLYSESVKQWEDVLRTADDYGRSFFEAMGDGMKGVSDWAKKVGEDLKKWVLDTLYELAKKWVLNVVMNMSANGSVSGGGMMGMGGGSSSGMNSLLSNATSLGSAAFGTAGSAAMFSTFGGAGASQAAILAAQTAEFGAAGTGLTLSALGGAGSATAGLGSLMTAMAPLMAAAPYIAAAVAVAMIVYQIVKSKEGGPKSGGFAQSGNDVGLRFFTPSNADTGLKKLVDTQEEGYDSLVKAMGGTNKANFAIGYDTDPMGKADNRVSAGVYVDGKEVYGVHDRVVLDAKGTGSRDEKDLQNAINSEMKKSLLAALQNSDLPAQISRLLNSMTAASATDADIDNMLKMAQTVMAMNEALDALADPMTAASDALEAASMTALDAWDKQRDALYNLANEAPNTAAGLDAVTAATGAFAQSTVNLLAGIMAAKAQLDEMFGNTRETIETSGMNDQQLYAREQKKADDWYKQLQVATDPEEITRLAHNIDESINKAFGLLSPEQQQEHQQEFLDGLDRTQQTASERMDLVMTGVAEQAKTDREFMSTKLDQILAGIEAAGTAFAAGAADLKDGIDVNVHVDDDRVTAEVTQ